MVDGPAKTLGIAAGAAAATAMLDVRDGDGRYVQVPLTIGTEPGEWRPISPATVTDPNSWISEVDPFTLLSTSQFRTPGPRKLTSAAYAHEYNEVKSLGARDSPRSPEQDAVARSTSARQTSRALGSVGKSPNGSTATPSDPWTDDSLFARAYEDARTGETQERGRGARQLDLRTGRPPGLSVGSRRVTW